MTPSGTRAARPARPDPQEWRRLAHALLDFERAPGRFAVALGEPRPVFRHIDSVMRFAAGRPVTGWPEHAPDAPALRRAARHFVRTVMLRPGADPLTVLGLAPGYSELQLREHHRLMIRLTHPDFVSAHGPWPADAATRVNLARQLLAARAYAPHQGHTAAMPGITVRPRPLLPMPSRARGNAHARRRFPRIRLALATGATLLVIAVLLMAPGGA